MSESLKDFVDRTSVQLFSEGDVDLVDDIMAAEFVDHDPLWPEQPEGPEGTKAKIQMLRAAFPDFEAHNEIVMIDGDLATHLWVATGTHRGTFFGVPPTGRKITMKGIDILRLKNGKFVERWGASDNLSTMMQLGAIPSGEGS